ncbi:MAG: hypothetical protein WAV47_24740 [Blastocatellia bacterium]
MVSNPVERFTIEQYLAMERAAQYKSEYIDGEIVAMVGASELLSESMTLADGLHLSSIDCRLKLSVVYDKITGR